MAGKVLQQIVSGPPLETPGAREGAKGQGATGEPAALARQTVFQEDRELPLSMQDIAAALDAKRTEQKANLRRLAALLQEACDILNGFDA